MVNVAEKANGQTSIPLFSPHYRERGILHIFFLSFFFDCFDDHIERWSEGLGQQWKHFRSVIIKKATLIKSIFRYIGCGGPDPAARDSLAILMPVISSIPNGDQ